MPRLPILNQFVCPYCFQKYSKSEVLYVCPDCGQITAPGLSERGKISIRCRNVSPNSSRPCGGIATLRVCPRCGTDQDGKPLFGQGDDTGIIPNQALDTRNLPFSIVGAGASGKTIFITVMMEELKRVPGLRLAVAYENSYTRDTHEANRRAIYDEHTIPEATVSGTRFPQLWQIKNLSGRRGDTVPTLTLTVYDGAGEDYEHIDPTSNVCKYISASRSIILTVDPLILRNLRRDIDSAVLASSGGDEQHLSAMDVIQSAADYIKIARGVNINRKLDVPVAVVLTKFDTILSHPRLPRNAVVRSPSLTISNGKLNTSEFVQVDEEIRDWLYSIDEGAFIDAIDANFREFQFFGVSSFGKPPKTRGTLEDELQPHRVLDPIFWLFQREKFIS